MARQELSLEARQKLWTDAWRILITKTVNSGRLQETTTDISTTEKPTE